MRARRGWLHRSSLPESGVPETDAPPTPSSAFPSFPPAPHGYPVGDAPRFALSRLPGAAYIGPSHRVSAAAASRDGPARPRQWPSRVPVRRHEVRAPPRGRDDHQRKEHT
jgi:hypothetical protein